MVCFRFSKDCVWLLLYIVQRQICSQKFDRKCRYVNRLLLPGGMTKYRKGPQRIHKGPQRTTKDPQRTAKEHYTGPQRIGIHDRTARLATILFNLKKYIYCLFFVILYFLCFFCVFWSFSELWRFMKRPFWDPAQINQFLLLVLCGRHLVDDDFPVSSQHLDSGRSGCHR